MLHHLRCRAGQRLLVIGVVGEGRPHFDGLAFVGGDQSVGGVRCVRDIRVAVPVGSESTGSCMRRWSVRLIGDARCVRRQRLVTWPVPLMVGRPVAGVLGLEATAVVAALVSVSWLSAASVKLTLTLMVLPLSAETSV